MNYDQLSDEELNLAVAKRQGYQWYKHQTTGGIILTDYRFDIFPDGVPSDCTPVDGPPNPLPKFEHSYNFAPEFSTAIQYAMLLAKEMISKGWVFELQYGKNQEWFCSFDKTHTVHDDESDVAVNAPTAERAICIAYLKASEK